MIFKQYTRRIVLGVASGIFAGLAAALFLISLEWATLLRQAHPNFIWGLPFAGLFIGWMYQRFGRDVVRGHSLILDEIHDPQKTVPVSMTPLIFLSTVITHLFGGSAGREGTVVQMGASLSDQLSKYFRVEPDERKILLMAGMGAGFGAAIGAPWAGMIFGMEVISIGRIRLFAWFECAIASFVAYGTSLILSSPHSQFPAIEIPEFNFQTLVFVAGAGILFGLSAFIFSKLTHFIEKNLFKYISSPLLRPFLVGIVLVGLFLWEGTYRYTGLGISSIQEALMGPATFQDPAFKAFFTALTLGSGFKGGEFIPLVFIGTTLGSALAVLLPVSFQLLGALGFAAVFAGAANTPIACSLMAMEIFGFQIGPYALVACLMSYYFSGHQGIYKTQKIDLRKHHQFASSGAVLARSIMRLFSFARRMYDDSIHTPRRKK